MLCQACGQRPATVTIKETINGRTHEMYLCHACAEERAFFEESSLFDSLFGHKEQSPLLEFSFKPERVNVLEFFSERAKKVLTMSIEEAKRLGSPYVDTEHLLLALLKEEVAQEILEKLKINTEDIEAYLEENIEKRKEKIKRVELSPRAKKVLELALFEAKKLGHGFVGSEHILLGLIREGEGLAAQILNKYNLDKNKVKIIIVDTVGRGKIAKFRNTTPTLDQYSRDLTALASEGKLDPVVGREDEIARVIQILSRRTKNNPVLIGEPGVGKTAIAEGLAQKIISNNVPEPLKNKRVLAIDIGAIVAGTKYRGEFEKRLKRIMEEIRQSKKTIIVFIDELHTIIGTGAAEGAIDASNLLKPALARGELQAIGATTLDEYRKYVEKDAALERRFQPILVNEPSIKVSIEILRGLRDKYEAHHKVQISDEAIIAATSLSDRYLADRFLPDKAIDLIDEAAAKVRLSALNAPEELKKLEKEIKRLEKERESVSKNKLRFKNLTKKLKSLESEKSKTEADWQKRKGTKQPIVLSSDIEEIVSKWTGIPVTQLAEEEVGKLLKLEEKLHERIVGQDEAIKAVSEAVRRGRAGLKDPNRPIGSFIFLGPTGVGKTELTKVLASLLFGDEKALIRIDMSEYMEKHTVSRLIGAPPGYVGHEEGGQLTEKVRQRPYSVILLDEIEKAHPDVFNILLQILEDGRLTDSKGRVIDFKNTVIIGTSNTGSNLIQEAGEKKLGFEDKKEKSYQTLEETEGYEDLKNQLIMELKKTFKPEFLNRIDEIIVFRSLTRKQIRQILDLMLKDIQQLLQGQNIKLKVSSAVKEKLASEGFDPSFGARPLRRTIQKRIENPLSASLLAGKFKSGDIIKVDLIKENKFSFKRIKEKARIKSLV